MHTRHEESSAVISAPRERVFAALDDHSRLSSHMSKSSWQMGGGKMETVVDAQQGKSVGSHIILRGRVFGVSLFVEEVVIAHDPPVRKTWETIGTPRLLVIGPYRMSFELEGSGTGTRLRVTIDYELPVRGVGRLLGRLFGRMYARWCTQQMVRDAARLFAAPATTV
jgi:carbon monoxide dehydrogenase subunit G